MMKERILWLDIAKGLAIILMVITHSSIPMEFSNFIFSFHMPLFFISSGWTTNWNNQKFLVFIRHKSRQLLLPFAIYSLIVLSIHVVVGWKSIESFIVKGWEGYALWFIPVLYFALIGTKALLIMRKPLFRYLFLALIVALGYLLCKTKIYIPWALSTVPYAILFVFLGGRLKKISLIICQPKWYIIIILFIVTFLVSQMGRLDMCVNQITPLVPITIGAISGTLLVFLISMNIERYSKFLTKVLVDIGRETYIVVAFSQIIIMLFNEYFYLNSIIKYVLLIVVLIVLKYAKDTFNELIHTKIL